MNKLYWIIGAAAMFAAGGAQAQGYGYQGYGYQGDDLPPPAYAYYGHQYGGGGCGGRFTIVGAHAGVTVLGIDIGGGASASIPLYCDRGQGYAPQAYAPPPQPVYQPPVYQPPVYQPPQYAPQAYYAPPAPMYPPQYAAPPCGCERPQGW
jgi:hypothetical protein